MNDDIKVYPAASANGGVETDCLRVRFAADDKGSSIRRDCSPINTVTGW